MRSSQVIEPLFLARSRPLDAAHFTEVSRACERAVVLHFPAEQERRRLHAHRELHGTSVDIARNGRRAIAACVGSGEFTLVLLQLERRRRTADLHLEGHAPLAGQIDWNGLVGTW